MTQGVWGGEQSAAGSGRILCLFIAQGRSQDLTFRGGESLKVVSRECVECQVAYYDVKVVDGFETRFSTTSHGAVADL